MKRHIRIFDTTLRDGEQSPGASMNVEEKVLVAKQLARLNVDIIEAGFAFSSPGDFEAVQRIGQEVEGPTVCSLARAKPADIDSAWKALQGAPKPRIHTFLSTSDIHLKHQFRMTREEALQRAVEMVRHARSYVDDVEFSPMDATRSDVSYLCEVVEAVVEAGASTVNIPDTVGYTTPKEFEDIIRTLRTRVRDCDRAVISVHCHNDLGLAVANSMAAIHAGAGQVECTINGIGERAGNASMEEIVMGLRTRKDFYDAGTQIRTEEISKTSRLVSKITGMVVQPNKAIVGANAFAHTSGIHQDGLLKDKNTYEIMRPDSIGLTQSRLVMGKLSGRHAFRAELAKLGYTLSDEEVNAAFERFKRLADQKKELFEEDLESIVSEARHQGARTLFLKVPEYAKWDESIADGDRGVGGGRPGDEGDGHGRWPGRRGVSNHCPDHANQKQIIGLRGQSHYRRNGRARRGVGADRTGRRNRHRERGEYRHHRGLGPSVFECPE